MTEARIDPQSVPGWATDADPRNDPTFPIRSREAEPDDHGLTWTRPPLQARTVEVLTSIEHNRLPAVFGTTLPPKGVSGALRRVAFRFSESQWAHWLLLMLADRVNVVEGVVEDVRGGRPPNIPREFGLASEWTHNRPALLRRLALAFGVGVVVAGVVSRSRAARAC